MINIEKTLGEYSVNEILYKECKEKIEILVVNILKQHQIKVHFISSRVKDKVSLYNKLNSKRESYNSIEDLTDLIGIRIVTFFEEDVNTVADIIKKEFEIDNENSVDKREADYDRFGYSSVHYIVKLNSDRNKLLEYKNISKLKVEIQIRSILQHAWAEIEHDIGYKNKESVPNAIKRNFSRVSALLEIADNEFNKMKNTIIKYKSELPNQVAKNPDMVKIDRNSIEYFLKKNKNLHEIDILLTKRINSELKPTDNEFEYTLYPTLLKVLGIDNLEKLENELIKNQDEIIEFAYHFNTDALEISTTGHYSYGVSIFYLGYLLAIRRNDDEFLLNYLNSFLKNVDFKKVVERLKRAFSSIKSI